MEFVCLFVCLRDEVTGGWRISHNEGLHNLCSLSNIITILRTRIRWARNVACMGIEQEYIYSFGGKRRKETTRNVCGG
jgi:hypothetical protein